MNVTFEDVRSLLDRWVDEAVNHLSTTFPNVTRDVLDPVVHQQVINAVENLLVEKFKAAQPASFTPVAINN